MKKEHLDKLRPLFLRQRNLENTKISLAKFDGITTGEEFFGDIAAPPSLQNVELGPIVIWRLSLR